jgi:Resolvase, N terminal domain
MARALTLRCVSSVPPAREKSGARLPAARRPTARLRRLLDQLDAGDVLMVTRLDRLARSTRDLLNILAAIADKKAGFRSLGDTWADTTTSHGRLMLTVLGGLAEFERDLIRARTSEDRARAVANGVKLGRKPTLTPHQQREAVNRVNAEKQTLGEITHSERCLSCVSRRPLGNGTFEGPIMEDLQKSYTLTTAGDPAMESMLQSFFIELYDLAACSRSDVLTDQLVAQYGLPPR